MLKLIRRFGYCSVVSTRLISRFNGHCSIASPSMDKSDEKTDQLVPFHNEDANFTDHFRGTCGFPLFWHDETQLNSNEIKVVDLDTWRVSSGLAHVSKGTGYESDLREFCREDVGDGDINSLKRVEDVPDFDEIEDMRMHGSLFYKIDRGSMEFEEYKFEFRGRKPSSIKIDKRESKSKEKPSCDSSPKWQNSLKGDECLKETKKNLSRNDKTFVNKERLIRTIKESYIVYPPLANANSGVQKKQRAPTFNQLTGPYHEPFCLDIYVSRGSVRACVVHRATSKVVAVAHSISKDMKFDLGSTKSTAAAAAVGKVLAQRALADDIHNVIFMPRKGNRLEGKLQIVLQSIVENGVDVKVKLKQMNRSKPIGKPSM